MKISICVGSSCYLKGSHAIVELLQKSINEHNLADKISLMGSLCIGKCNRVGVTVQVDEEIHIGITPENYSDFFRQHILSKFTGE